MTFESHVLTGFLTTSPKLLSTLIARDLPHARTAVRCVTAVSCTVSGALPIGPAGAHAAKRPANALSQASYVQLIVVVCDILPL